MTDFPRTHIETLSVSRLIIGTNWFLGFSHTSKAKDAFIKEYMTARRVADVLEVCMRAGVDTMLGMRPDQKLIDAIKDAEDRTGRRMITIGTPRLETKQGIEPARANEEVIAQFAQIGVSVCMPHQSTTDYLVNGRDRTFLDMKEICAIIRRHGMIPGLSTHRADTPGIADRTGLDVGTYMQLYNAAGFLMQIEVDWVHRMIWRAQKPVITFKPLAAGRLHPFVGLAFVWNTIRPRDMVTIGCMTPDEARETIELSLAALEHRVPNVELQKTRSKEGLAEGT